LKTAFSTAMLKLWETRKKSALNYYYLFFCKKLLKEIDKNRIYENSQVDTPPLPKNKIKGTHIG
jgi:hypothetical protein